MVATCAADQGLKPRRPLPKGRGCGGGYAFGLLTAPESPLAYIPRLLLIDANARLGAMVADYLRNAGFDVDLAATLSEGRRRLLLDNFDALVLDFMLPDSDGLDLTRDLRADSRTQRLPLLVLTTRG